MIPALYRVDHRREDYPGVFTLRISQQNTVQSKDFQPGQFNMLYAFGCGEVPISMSGTASDPNSGMRGYVHTIRAQGLTTQALERLRAGDTLGVRGPFGQGWPMAALAGKEVIIVAGGLGLAPLRPLIYSLLGDKTRTQRIRLFYGARRPGEMLYRQELMQWSSQLEVVVTVDHADEAWAGQVGVITAPLTMAEIDTDNTIVVLCGPEVMMRFCIQSLLAKGVPESSIYLSMERNMKCAIGHCGHCQWGPHFVCKDGPVFCYGSIRKWFNIRAL